jgi:ATP-binding cassette, subfamily B, bacterial
VAQEALLFRATLAQNIAYGKPDATRDDIARAATLANAHEFIVRMPRDYDTVVGERGDTLSGGQRQRIAIARALIRDARILLLDEPSASLDPESEELIFRGLSRLMAGRTSITIADRLATVRRADVICVLDPRRSCRPDRPLSARHRHTGGDTLREPRISPHGPHRHRRSVRSAPAV